MANFNINKAGWAIVGLFLLVWGHRARLLDGRPGRTAVVGVSRLQRRADFGDYQF